MAITVGQYECTCVSFIRVWHSNIMLCDTQSILIIEDWNVIKMMISTELELKVPL